MPQVGKGDAGRVAVEVNKIDALAVPGDAEAGHHVLSRRHSLVLLIAVERICGASGPTSSGHRQACESYTLN